MAHATSPEGPANAERDALSVVYDLITDALDMLTAAAATEATLRDPSRAAGLQKCLDATRAMAQTRLHDAAQLIEQSAGRHR
jgi:hypothetical protein